MVWDVLSENSHWDSPSWHPNPQIKDILKPSSRCFGCAGKKPFQQTILVWVVVSNILYICLSLPGGMIQFDDHIFQMG